MAKDVVRRENTIKPDLPSCLLVFPIGKRIESDLETQRRFAKEERDRK
jgi:hypothetical protein